MKKGILRFLLSAVVVLLAFIFVEQCIAFAVIPGSSYARTQMHEFYEADNIDLVFVGPSYVYRGVDTSITDSLTGLTTFNLGTSAQKPIDSYFMIKEAYRVHNVKYVVLDVSTSFYIESEYTNQNTSTYIIYDRMENSPVKREYFTSAFSLDEYPTAFFKSSHYKDNTLSTMISNVKYKFSDDYKEYKAPSYRNEWYSGKGFVDSIGSYIPNAEITKVNSTSSEDALMWLDKIIKFCKDNNITLIAATSPKTADYIETYTSYDDLYKIFSKKFTDAGFKYLDINKSSYFIEYTNDDFMDIGHLNGTGAEKYSTMISYFINEIITVSK